MRILVIGIGLLAAGCGLENKDQVSASPVPLVLLESASAKSASAADTVEAGDSSGSRTPMDTVYRDLTPRMPTAAELLADVVRLPLDSFPQLPKPVRAELGQRGCTVPQVYSPAQNVVTGAFTAKDAVEWAVLCSISYTSQILVIDGLTGAVIDSLDRQPDTDWVQGGARVRWEYARILSVVPMADLQHWRLENDGTPVPRPIDHDAIGQGFQDKYAEALYWGGRR
jgi:hypothetical protein